jgi:hypothetical protein
MSVLALEIPPVRILVLLFFWSAMRQVFYSKTGQVSIEKLALKRIGLSPRTYQGGTNSRA